VEIGDLSEPPKGAASAELRPLVAAARAIQEERFRDTGVHVNAHMTTPQIEEQCRLDNKGLKMLEAAADRLSLSARAYTRIKKIARAKADFAGAMEIKASHVAEAIQYRGWTGGRGEEGGRGL